MKLLSRSSILLLCACTLLYPGCRRRRASSGPEDLAKVLGTYDFKRTTPDTLDRFCRSSPSGSGYSKARYLFLCARAALDFYLAAAFLEEQPMFDRLLLHLGLRCEGPNRRCGRALLDALEERFERARLSDAGGRLDWPARQAMRLIRLQRDEAGRWDYAFLSGIRDLAQHNQPMEVEARLIVAGATRHVVSELLRIPANKRPGLLVRTLGFPCPVEATEGSSSSGTAARKPSCPMACPEIAHRLVQQPPEQRKRLIAVHCPISHLGFTSREQGIYLTPQGLVTARTMVFAAANIETLVSSASHPLLESLRPELRKIMGMLERIKVPVPYPEMSLGEAGYIRIPFCSVADEDPLVALYVAVDLKRVLVGVLPILSLERSRTVVLGHREGYLFPGRMLSGPVDSHLKPALDQARQIWQRLMGTDVSSDEPLGLYVDLDVTAEVLNRVLAAARCADMGKVRFLLRTEKGRVGGLTVEIVDLPKKQPKGKGSKAATAEVTLELDRKRIRLYATQGKLKDDPLNTNAGDLAGLREKLEKTRKAYSDVAFLSIVLEGDVRFLTIAQTLVSVMRNSSGRALYPQVRLKVPYLGSCSR